MKIHVLLNIISSMFEAKLMLAFMIDVYSFIVQKLFLENGFECIDTVSLYILSRRLHCWRGVELYTDNYLNIIWIHFILFLYVFE